MLKKVYIYSLVHNCLGISVCKGRRVVVEYYCSLTPLTCSIGKPGVGQVGKICAWPRSVGTWVVSQKQPKAWRLDLPKIIPRGLKLSHVPFGGTDK